MGIALCEPFSRKAHGDRPAAFEGTVAEVAGRCWPPLAAKVDHLQNGQGRIYHLHYGAEPIWLTERKERPLLAIVVGFGKIP